MLGNGKESGSSACDKETSLGGMATLPSPASGGGYKLWHWNDTSCLSFLMPPGYTPSFACVGEGTTWGLDWQGEIFEEGSDLYPIVALTSTIPQGESDYFVKKIVDLPTSFHFQMYGGSMSRGVFWSMMMLHDASNFQRIHQHPGGPFSLPYWCVA